MRTLAKRTCIAIFSIAVVWTLLTLWAESTGPKRSWQLGNGHASETILIVYDPDPFYNLDEQISRALGNALAEQGLSVRVMTVAAATDMADQSADAYVFCANTYNWRPDWAVCDFIKKAPLLGQPVVAITLGSGSTEDSQKALETLILTNRGVLLDSHSLWLWRPNDESRLEESNTKIAVSMAHRWGKELAEQIKPGAF